MAKSRKLPPRVFVKHGAFYYVHRNKWTRLGKTEAEMLAAYALISNRPDDSMSALIDSATPSVLKGRSANTIAQYDGALRRLKKAFEEFSVDDVKQRHVAKFKLNMAATPNMGNRMLSVLRLVFDYAVEQQLVDSNPCVGIKRHPEAKRPRYVTDAEMAAVRAVVSPRMQLMIDLLYLTGQRIGDVLALRRGAILPEGLAFKQEKTGARLALAWTPALRQCIDDALALHGDLPRVTIFFGRGSKPADYRTVRDQWEAGCVLAGVVDAHLHDIRAKSLTDAKRQGHDAQALGGHASAAMTERYIRLRDTPLVHGPSGLSKIV